MLCLFLRMRTLGAQGSILIQWNPQINTSILESMVKLTTKLSFDIRLEAKHVRETARAISKVLRVTKETIRTRFRKIT